MSNVPDVSGDDQPPGDSTATDEATERRQVRDEILIAALASGRTDGEAAELAGCSARTVRRLRCEDPTFGRRVSERRAERVAAQAGRLIELGDRARETMEACLDDEVAHVRLRAADLLQRGGERQHRASHVDVEIAELRARINALLAIQAESDDTTGTNRGEGL